MINVAEKTHKSKKETPRDCPHFCFDWLCQWIHVEHWDVHNVAGGRVEKEIKIFMLKVQPFDGATFSCIENKRPTSHPGISGTNSFNFPWPFLVDNHNAHILIVHIFLGSSATEATAFNWTKQSIARLIEHYFVYKTTRALISVEAACLSKQVWQNLYRMAAKVIKVATFGCSHQ